MKIIELSAWEGVRFMCCYIGIEDLASNALIEQLKRSGDRFVSYKTLEDYGMAVVNILGEKGEEGILTLSRDRTNAFFRDYSDYFEEKEINNETGIYLREDKDLNNLISKFSGYLSFDLFLAFINKDSVKKLGING